MSLSGLIHYLFKSLPVKEHLVLPKTTPSGFTIGKILKMYYSLKSWLFFEFPSKNVINP